VPEQAIAVLGIGYVGLPLSLALARHHPRVVGFDTDHARIAELRSGTDRNAIGEAALEIPASLVLTSEPGDIACASVYIVTVPTPISSDRRPDLSLVRSACRTIAASIAPGDLVIVESTLYPGATEEVCGPLIAEVSGLRAGIDFALGYSPERISPGDGHRTLESVTRIIAGQDNPTLERMAALYGPVISGGLHRAASIQVAEAAKIVENVQRDLNIALMNELAMIFDRLGLRTTEVLEAAATKWNFQRFTPGLVGGHCIGVDPHYLISRAESLGYYPEVIRAARRLNGELPGFVVRRILTLLSGAACTPQSARIGVLGMTFKENVSDFRNSQSPAIVHALRDYGAEVLAHDPHANAVALAEATGIETCGLDRPTGLDALVLAVPHSVYLEDSPARLTGLLRPDGARVLIDIKSALDPATLAGDITYWSL